jgi:ribosomal silencing factor RsfS
MLDALAKSVIEFLHHSYHLSAVIEGESREGWILIDAGDIILHIFSPEVVIIINLKIFGLRKNPSSRSIKIG